MRSKANILFLGIAIAAIGTVVWLQLHRSPKRIAESISGLDLPSDIRLLSRREEWQGFLGDGNALLVFTIPPEFGARMRETCEDLGYLLGKSSNITSTLGYVDEWYDSGETSCSKVERNSDFHKIIIISADKMLVYYANL